jgi:hypothetical protein
MMSGTERQLAQAMAVQNKYIDELMKQEHVVGVTVAPTRQNENDWETFAVIILVDEKVPEERFPTELDGIPVVVREIGTVKAL